MDKYKNLDKCIKVVNARRGRIDGIVATLVRERKSHEWFLHKLRDQVYEGEEWLRLPRWAQTEVQAYAQGQIQVVRSQLVGFGYHYQGTLYGIGPNPKHLDLAWPPFPSVKAVFAGIGVPLTAEDCDAHGFYWPDGMPFSVNTKTETVTSGETA